MNQLKITPYTAFDGSSCIASGSLQKAVLAAKKALDSESSNPVLIFDNATGRTIDVDTRGTTDEICARFPEATTSGTEDHAGILAVTESKGRGRPKLGVTPREVTLLPRHWEWLAAQPGGASVALRKLVEEARRTSGEKDKLRKAQERAYHFMLVMAGNMPGFEEATRALFAKDAEKYRNLLTDWPCDVRDHALQLAFDDQP